MILSAPVLTTGAEFIILYMIFFSYRGWNMEELLELYTTMGISPAVYAYGEEIINKIKDRFNQIDKIAEYNQAKVLKAMQKNRVSAACFAGTTGYGYDDVGRDNLERVYADVFHTEAALVRPQITCGTHAGLWKRRPAGMLGNPSGGNRCPKAWRFLAVYFSGRAHLDV